MPLGRRRDGFVNRVVVREHVRVTFDKRTGRNLFVWHRIARLVRARCERLSGLQSNFLRLRVRSLVACSCARFLKVPVDIRTAAEILRRINGFVSNRTKRVDFRFACPRANRGFPVHGTWLVFFCPLIPN